MTLQPVLVAEHGGKFMKLILASSNLAMIAYGSAWHSHVYIARGWLILLFMIGWPWPGHDLDGYVVDIDLGISYPWLDFSFVNMTMRVCSPNKHEFIIRKQVHLINTTLCGIWYVKGIHTWADSCINEMIRGINAIFKTLPKVCWMLLARIECWWVYFPLTSNRGLI